MCLEISDRQQNRWLPVSHHDVTSSCTFDSPDADVILRTSLQPGLSDFKGSRVHKLILSIASTVFRDTFSIPQPPCASDDTSLDIVQITESSSDSFTRSTPLHSQICGCWTTSSNFRTNTERGALPRGSRDTSSPLPSQRATRLGYSLSLFATTLRSGEGGDPTHVLDDVVRQISEEQIQTMTTKTYHRLLMEHTTRRELLRCAVDKVQYTSHGACSCFGALKENIPLEISQRPSLDREYPR